MFIESNVGSLTEMFVVLVTMANDFKKEGVISKVSVMYGDVIWNSNKNIIRRRRRNERKEIGYAIDIKGDINDNDIDMKILQYKINKKLSEFFDAEYYENNDAAIRFYYSPDFIDILFLENILDKK